MKKIDGLMLKKMIANGSKHLSNQKQAIDALNVFPVPDGDTGSNMSMTFTNGYQSVLPLEDKNISIVAKTLSKGLLMGARGNSGVILSQIFRGFYQALEKCAEANTLEIAKAFSHGATVAYKAVMRPVEGTILTVIREASYYAQQKAEVSDMSIEEYFDCLCHEARVSLDNTPELLPVLKEVGVVDSGGTGLCVVLEGFKEALLGNVIDTVDISNANEASQLEFESDEFGYCTEFILRLDEKKMKHFKVDRLRKKLSDIGDSLVVVQDEELVKVHVHTLKPGNALNIGQLYGEFVKLKIENMQEQHSHIVSQKMQIDQIEEANEAHKEYGIVAVSAGDGLDKVFKECRVDRIVSGGQTMNPSTEDFVEVIQNLNASKIFVLPNNSNIILAAKQAADILTDKEVYVFETKSIPEGLSACLMFNPEVSKEENIEEMQQAINRVKTGQVTYAVKDTQFENVEIKEGDYIGISGKNIVESSKDRLHTTLCLLDDLITSESEIVTLIYNDDASEFEINSIEKYVNETFDIDVECIAGGQPVYTYIIGVE